MGCIFTPTRVKCVAQLARIKRNSGLPAYRLISSGGSRKFWWGGDLKPKPQKFDVFTKIETDFSPEIGNSNVIFAQNQVGLQKKKRKKVFTKIETDFSPEIGNSNVIFAQNQVVSKKKKKKKKKKKGLHQN